MALARIFSRYPEQTTVLSQQLQQQGYMVEVLNPDEAPATLADLEIQLEVCDPADVLRRAAELASQLHADIAIAPGALPASSPAEHLAPAVTAAAPELTIAEPAILPAAMETETHAAAAQAVRPKRLARAARASGAALAAFAWGARELLASARAALHERLEQARVLATEASERRQERLLELTRRRAEALQHAVALKSSRRALSAYLLQLQRDYPDVLPEAGSKPTPAVERPVSAWPGKIRRIHIRKWEAVLAGVVSATALFVVGLAVASFHSRPAPSANRGVTLHGPQAKPASPARPSPVVRKTTPKPAAQAHRTQRKAPQRKVQQRDQDLVAHDVVVRRFAPPKPTPAPQADGWKHFSDTSN